MEREAWLVAVNPAGERNSWPLQPGEYQVGRGDGSTDARLFTTSGDPLISRRHFIITWSNGELAVRKLESAKNPLFYQGSISEGFSVSPGDSFTVGKTRFYVVSEESSSEPMDSKQEFALISAARDEARKRRVNECFQAMMGLLPELRKSTDIDQIWSHALRVLQSLLPDASIVRALRLRRSGEDVNWENLDALPRALAETVGLPSRRLLKRALEERTTVTHVWTQTSGGEAMTEFASINWAVTSPILISGDEQYALYAVGSRAQGWDTQEVVDEAMEEKQQLDERAALVDIVAETTGHHLAVQRVTRIEGQVGQFFSPVLRKLLVEEGFAEALRPTRGTVSVLFFDLRGFSKATEAAESDALDQILQHHEKLTEVMTAVTQCVFDEEGVVVDYQGDAVMACWGAPRPIEDHAHRAVRCAQRIAEKVHAMDLPFQHAQGERTMRCGMGLGSGEVIAGQVGAREQVKFGVMGRVVNLASRLEGLTKRLGVPILINEEMQALLPPEVVLRLIGRVRPAGVREPVTVYEVVVPVESGGTGLASDEIAAYQAAYEHFAARNWKEAQRELRKVPLEDQVQSFLYETILHFQKTEPPAEWNGLLEFTSK